MPVVGVERSGTDPSSIAFFDALGLTTVNNVEDVAGQVALVYALRGAQGNFGVGEDADELLPGLLQRPEVDRRTVISGLVLSAAVAALFAGRWLDDMARSGLVRENYRGVHPAFPAGAVLIACSLVALAPLAVLDDRADLDLLDPELRRWATYILGVAFLGLLDDSLGRGASVDTPRGWRGHARAVVAGRFSTGAIKAVGALALAAYAVSGRGRENVDYVADLALLLLATNLFNLLDLRPGRVEKAFILLLAGLCLAGVDGRAGRAAGPLRRPGAGGGLVHAAGASDAGRHRIEPRREPSPGSRCWCVLGDEARLIALAIVAGAHDLWGVSVDLFRDRALSATAPTRLARQSE